MRWSAADVRGTAAVVDAWRDLLTADVPPGGLQLRPGVHPQIGEVLAEISWVVVEP